MKNIIIALFLSVAWLTGCTGFLEVEPRNKVTPDALLSTPEGVQMYMANLYSRLPVEDFNMNMTRGTSPFNLGIGSLGGYGDPNAGGFWPAHMTDEAVHAEFNDWAPNEAADYWEAGYKLIRDINTLLEIIEDLNVSEDEKVVMRGEAYFLRAFTYFALAKRYGGVSIIEKPQNMDDEDLIVPRSTERKTWDFIMEDCDRAAGMLDYSSDTRRASKGVVLALKSRAALYAASVAKFTHTPYVSLVGQAVDLGLIGMPSSDADYFYGLCLDASWELMQSGRYGLYQPDPASPAEAAANYQALFESPNAAITGAQEPIFIKGFTMNTALTHNYDIWNNPRQTPPAGWQYLGKINPTLELVETYETYSNDGQRHNASLCTRLDGNESSYEDMGDYSSHGDYFGPVNKHYRYDTPYQIFDNIDARFWGTMIAPGTTWKNTEINIQAGLVRADGSYVYVTHEEYEKNGVKYYSLGAENWTDFSGFLQDWGRYTKSGFLTKKFLQEKTDVVGAWFRSDTDWIEFRYAEILLNYAEAAIEMTAPPADALSRGRDALNALRRRAAHTDQIPLTVDNVRAERFVELAFENKRIWDLKRWRIYHTEFVNRVRKGLAPFLDLRENDPKYVFVRITPVNEWPKSFFDYDYYRRIPGTGSNGLIQNP